MYVHMYCETIRVDIIRDGTRRKRYYYFNVRMYKDKRLTYFVRTIRLRKIEVTAKTENPKRRQKL